MNKYLELVQKLKTEENTKRIVNRSDTFLTLPKLDLIKDTNNLIKVRLLPDFKTSTDVVGPFVQHTHFFKSKKDGSLINITCPPKDELGHYTCPLCLHSLNLYRQGKLDKELSGKTNNYMNVYVINNPYDPSQNGQVRVIKYGSQLNEVINDAINGRFKSVFGNKIFDLSKSGCTLIIRCEKRGKWPDYGRSYFETEENSMDDVKNLSETTINEIYESAFKISDILSKPNSIEDIKKIMAEHLCVGECIVEAENKDVDDDVDLEENSAQKVASTNSTNNSSKSDEAEFDEDKQLMSLLEGL